MIEHLVFIKEAAQGDDDIFARNTRRKISLQHHLRHFWHLPPCHSGSPNTGSIGSDDRRAERSHRAI